MIYKTQKVRTGGGVNWRRIVEKKSQGPARLTGISFAHLQVASPLGPQPAQAGRLASLW
jgi:hypothetical protein